MLTGFNVVSKAIQAKVCNVIEMLLLLIDLCLVYNLRNLDTEMLVDDGMSFCSLENGFRSTFSLMTPLASFRPPLVFKTS